MVDFSQDLVDVRQYNVNNGENLAQAIACEIYSPEIFEQKCTPMVTGEQSCQESAAEFVYHHKGEGSKGAFQRFPALIDDVQSSSP